MSQVQGNRNLSDGGGNSDRRQPTVLNRVRRTAIDVARSKWLAMFAIAFSVSWAFHEFDEHNTHKLQRQQRVLECTIQTVANQQLLDNRVLVRPILQRCQQLEDKK